MTDNTTNKMNFLIKEYEKIKDEQRTRIDFRDRMTFLALGAIGTVFSFVIEKPDYITALLVLPFICIVLGWTYLTNDEKISQIGTYCKNILIPKVENIGSDLSFSMLPSWEEFHLSIERRKERKIIQLIIDLGLFCISAFASIFAFFYLGKCYTCTHIIIALAEILLILYLAYQFISYSRLKKN